MTLAEKEIPTFEVFASETCNLCTANDWYCPSYCEMLEKAKRIFPFVQIAWNRHNGDIYKVWQYIKRSRR